MKQYTWEEIFQKANCHHWYVRETNTFINCVVSSYYRLDSTRPKIERAWHTYPIAPGMYIHVEHLHSGFHVRLQLPLYQNLSDNNLRWQYPCVVQSFAKVSQDIVARMHYVLNDKYERAKIRCQSLKAACKLFNAKG